MFLLSVVFSIMKVMRLSMHSWAAAPPNYRAAFVSDLAGEVMVDSQAQSLLLQSNKGRWALLATRHFSVGPPKAGTGRGWASVDGPTSKEHGTPDAVSHGRVEGLVGRGIVCSLAHIPMWVTRGPPSPLRSGALLGLVVSSCRKADWRTVMLHFWWALWNKSL